MTARISRVWAVLALVGGMAAPLGAQSAQTAGTAQSEAPARNDVRTADEARAELRQILRQYPPSVAEVLRLSPSLASDTGYLQPYPSLGAFLGSHPEVIQNPAFYFGSPRQPGDRDDQSPATRRTRIVSQMLDSVAVFAGLMTLLGVIGWLLKSVIDHQRWKRALKVQSEAHAKLLDRLATTDEVLAYAQTPAGRQFLESGAPIEAARRDVSAPIGRILWSVQMGMVIAVLGVGIFVCAGRLGADPELADLSPFLFMMGTIAVSIGIGFLLSALVSYLLSRRLGLIGSPESSHA